MTEVSCIIACIRSDQRSVIGISASGTGRRQNAQKRTPNNMGKRRTESQNAGNSRTLHKTNGNIGFSGNKRKKKNFQHIYGAK